MASVSCLLSEDQFLCSICLEVFTDPVTTTCGHSFCNVCINKHWDKCVHCHCPVCKEEFRSRPQLKTSTVLSEMVSAFRNKPLREDTRRSKSEAAAVGDVLCDVCPEPKLKALKSCLVCQMSFCPDHLAPHNTVPRLNKHQLIGPVENLEERLCPEHGRLLEKFCREHCQLLCVQCFSDHKNHKIVPLKQQCEEEQSALRQKIQERRNKLQELQRSVQISQENADREMKDGVDFFDDLLKCVLESRDQHIRNIKKKHKEVKEKAERFMNKLKTEISALEQRRAQMEEIWSFEDHFHFVQTFTLDKPALELKDWTEVFVRAPSYEVRAATAVSELQFRDINPKTKRLFGDKLDIVKAHAVNLTLDRATAHPNLVVSSNCKQVHCTDETQDLPDNPERFSTCAYVCSQEKFSSGRFYFEVQVKGSTDWYLGVVTESADRNADSDKITDQNGWWETSFQHAYEVCPAVEKVGVFVDYDEGLICFFDADSSALFHSFTNCRFTEGIFPLFYPDENPLIITPVKDQS